MATYNRRDAIREFGQMIAGLSASLIAAVAVPAGLMKAEKRRLDHLRFRDGDPLSTEKMNGIIDAIETVDQ